MKYSLYCFLFGHKWVGWTGRGNWLTGAEMRAQDNCSRCGLSKEEAGIITGHPTSHTESGTEYSPDFTSTPHTQEK